MIRDCLRVFEKYLEEYTDDLILANYVPKDGTYLLVQMDEGEFIPQEPVEISYDKKTGVIEGDSNTNYKFIQQLDYYSKLVEMNKPIDPKKIIHSNNYLTFFLKKESLATGKLTPDIISGYFEILKKPHIKYEKKAKAAELYRSLEKEIEEPDSRILQQIQDWIEMNLLDLEIEKSGKNYLKLFFVFSNQEKTINLYQKEGRRYLLPNIYNNNDSNLISSGKVYGLPNDNMGMNSKKPFLEHKTRKVKEPYLLSLDEVLMQSKFFDYLMGKASVGIAYVYVDTDDDKFHFCKQGQFPKDFSRGIFLKIQKGKEVEIHNSDVVTNYSYHLKKAFVYKEIIEIPPKILEKFEPGYGRKGDCSSLEMLFDHVFFGKWLKNNYFTEPMDLGVKDGVIKYNLLRARDRLFNWFYKNNTEGIESLLQSVSLELVKNALGIGNEIQAKHQLNLRWSIMDYFAENDEMEARMGQVRSLLRGHIDYRDEWDFSGTDEYYYAVGQLAAYFLTKTKGAKKPLSFINPFLNAKKDDIVKRRLVQMFKKVNYDMDLSDLRAKNLTSHVMAYQTDESVDQEMVIAGFTGSLLIYTKKEEDK